MFLAHHHLMLYQTHACYGLTAELLRHVLADAEGDVYPATLTAMGRYWRDVLSERTRTIDLQVGDDAVEVRNTGDRALTGLPMEIEFQGGRRCMRLVDVPPHSSVSVELGSPG